MILEADENRPMSYACNPWKSLVPLHKLNGEREKAERQKTDLQIQILDYVHIRASQWRFFSDEKEMKFAQSNTSDLVNVNMIPYTQRVGLSKATYTGSNSVKRYCPFHLREGIILKIIFHLPIQHMVIKSGKIWSKEM